MANVSDNLNFTLELEQGYSRFGSSTELDIEHLLESRHSSNTKKSTRRCVTVFREYLLEKGEPPNFEDFTQDKLKEILTRFYVDIRKKDGSEYKKSSLQNLKHGLKRYIQEKTGFDITCSDFNDTNNIYSAKVKQLKQIGKGDIKHKDPIEDEDLCKIYEYFEGYKENNRINPWILQQKVFFDLVLHLCR